MKRLVDGDVTVRGSGVAVGRVGSGWVGGGVSLKMPAASVHALADTVG